MCIRCKKCRKLYQHYFAISPVLLGSDGTKKAAQRRLFDILVAPDRLELSTKRL